MKKNRMSISISGIHHIGVIVKDIDKAIKDLEALGIGRFAHPALPRWLENILFKGKNFDKRYKLPGIKPFVHPRMYKVIEAGPTSSFADAGLFPMVMHKPDQKPDLNGAGTKNEIREHMKIYKAWAGNQIIELIQPGDEISHWGKHLKEKGEGIQHIGIQVDDLATVNRLIEAGAICLGGGTVLDGKGSFGFYMDFGNGIIADVFKGYY